MALPEARPPVVFFKALEDASDAARALLLDYEAWISRQADPAVSERLVDKYLSEVGR